MRKNFIAIYKTTWTGNIKKETIQIMSIKAFNRKLNDCMIFRPYNTKRFIKMTDAIGWVNSL